MDLNGEGVTIKDRDWPVHSKNLLIVILYDSYTLLVQVYPNSTADWFCLADHTGVI